MAGLRGLRGAGFGHAGDLSPALAQLMGTLGKPGRDMYGETYRDRKYVENEVTRFAQQLSEAA